MATARTFITSNFQRRLGFTYAELMLVVIILTLTAGFTGSYYVGTYKKTSLMSAARGLLLMGHYARMRAIEDGQPCQLYVDGVRRQFFLVAPVFDAVSRTKKQAVVSNPYCRKKTLEKSIEFEFVDIKPAMGEGEAGWDSGHCIHFYPDGRCDSAVIQMGNGRHSVTAVFSPAYSKIKICDGSIEAVETGTQVIDLDAAD